MMSTQIFTDFSYFVNMGCKGSVGGDQKNEERLTICLHAFSDLSRISPVIFVYLLKECYLRGTRKATTKFRFLQQQVMQILQNSPKPGPATFIVQSLYILPILGPPYTEGFSHLVISSLRRLQSVQTMPEDISEAKALAAQLFLASIAGFIDHGEGVLIKLVEAVDIRLKNIGEALYGLEANDDCLEKAKAFLEPFLSGLIESHSYMMAVTLLERFSIRKFDQPFLLRLMQENQFKAAEKWATFMGEPMLSILIQKYVDINMVQNAYDLIKKKNLQQEFPYVYYMYKESSLKKLAEKGCWEIAEARARNDRQLVEYLVYLAMEAGYSEYVDELCERYSLEGFMKATESEGSPLDTRFLNLNEFVVDDIVWVDETDGLLRATSHFEGCKVVGVDCEWKPNYVKGSSPNKVSIMQIASEKSVFILDMIKLSKDEPIVLDSCLKRILHSPKILKLGYNLQCDLKQLSHSYGDLECFRHYEMLLDIQNVFKEPRGGLSGLAEKILGSGLNKTRRNSNWEQRPLTQNQMEYAALDAVVLVHIFRHVRTQSLPSGVEDRLLTIEWKSNIVSRMDDNVKQPKKKYRSKVKKGRGQTAVSLKSN
ncbi:hypothetical protein GIB67_021862 [Kingdonia uniflora]|uniref:3'-5' exonuclease domain-containing protein n=1 Tax=Kingdonia uniflora TaxID=39325 RepID=A0A7J7NF34_9MAGN|nr:hypothetical protein GIB67_021862 [Kingdonia uniflora]